MRGKYVGRDYRLGEEGGIQNWVPLFFPSFGPMKSALSAWHYPHVGVNAQGRQAPQERCAVKVCGEKNTMAKKTMRRSEK